MNDHKNETRDEGKEGAQETALGDLEPRAEIKGGSSSGIYKVTDVTLKRGVIG